MKKQTGNGNGFRMGYQSSTLLLALAAGMLLAGTAQAGTKYWIGSGALGAQRQVWTNAANWETSPGAGGGAGMPGSGDDVIIDHNSTNAPLLNFNILTLPYTINSLTIGTNTASGYNNSTLIFTNGNVSDKVLNVTLDVTVGATGTLTHAAETSTSTSIDTENHRLYMVVGGNMTIALGGKINVTGRGYKGNAGPGTGNMSLGAAAGHGGEGGQSSTAVGGTTYGSVTNPVNSGSGDAAWGWGGEAGGGVVRLAIAGGLTLNGSIEADAYLPGTAYQNGRSSGGSVNISAARLEGNGSIYARGAAGGTSIPAAGGGRIAVVLTNADDTAFAALAAIRANGGSDSALSGAAGTVFLKGTNQTYGSVIVDNNGYAAYPPASTLVKNQTLLLDRIVATNSGVVMMGSGGLLDLTQGCALRSYGSSRFIPTGGILWPSAYTLTNVTFSWAGTGGAAITSDVTVASGALLTHETITSTGSNPENHKLIASIVGNLTVASGGQINVSAQGYSQENGPGGYVNNTRGGGSHGGVGGGMDGTTYGSVTNPLNAGTGGEGYNFGGGRAGGVVRLAISGVLTNNGTIAADGEVRANSTSDGYGAGGSVNVVAASLAGSGTISANGGYDTHASATGSGGGGGRIAIVLTNADDTAFAGLTVKAYGGPLKGAYENGAAGTVYLKGTNTAFGRLVVDNNLSATRRTLISASVTDTTVGDVLIRNSGYLGLASQTLTVYGSWSNAASFKADTGGIVRFDGTGALATNTLFGATTFGTLVCTNAGKTLLFQAGKTNTMLTALNIAGASGAGAISLLPATAGQQWYIKVTNSITPILSYLIVSNSTAVTNANGQTLTATFSTVADVGVDNSLNSNTNWSFPSPQPKVWNGSAGTSWGTDANWTPSGVPTPTDVSITIPSVTTPPGGAWPVLGANYVGASAYPCPFTIEFGASLSLGGWNLELGGLVTNAGTITATGSETLTFTSNVVFTGTGAFTPASSTVRLSAAGAQSATLNGQPFYNLSIANANAVTVTDSFAARNLTFPSTGANVTFGDSFAVTNLTLSVTGAATLNFAATKIYTVRNALYLRGASSANRAVLTSSGTWYLNALDYYTARQLAVTNSDATGSGKILYAVDSTGSGTTYWDFGAGNKLWAGTNTTWATDGNWLPSGAPGASSMVFIDGSTNTTPRVTAATTIAGLTMAGFAGAAGLTVDMPFAGPDSLAVSGDVNILTNATVTHTQGNETYRLAMNIVGNLTIYGGGKIDVTGKGFTSGSPGAAGAVRNGAGHGGEGGGTAGGTTYGSVTNPVRCGSHGSGDSTLAGGGVVKLTIGGTLTLNANASIQADGAVGTGNDSGASGGSVNIAAAALAGSGRISANGGRGNNAGTPGSGAGGGRIALVLTNNNDSAFDAWLANTNITAYGGTRSSATTEDGGAGTVYLKGADRTYGRLIVDNSTNSTPRRTLLNSATTDKTVGDVMLRNLGYMGLSAGETLTVYGSWSNAVATMTGGTNYGGTVVFAGTSPNPVTVWGGNTWSNLTIATLGKTVNFEMGKTQTVYGLPVFSNNVSLKSTANGTWWYLQKPGSGTQDVAVVTVQDSHAGTNTLQYTFQAAKGSVNNGNNVNWRFLQYGGTMFLLR